MLLAKGVKVDFADLAATDRKLLELQINTCQNNGENSVKQAEDRKIQRERERTADLSAVCVRERRREHMRISWAGRRLLCTKLKRRQLHSTNKDAKQGPGSRSDAQLGHAKRFCTLHSFAWTFFHVWICKKHGKRSNPMPKNMFYIPV